MPTSSTALLAGNARAALARTARMHQRAMTLFAPVPTNDDVSRWLALLTSPLQSLMPLLRYGTSSTTTRMERSR